jgi:hypothetical protein
MLRDRDKRHKIQTTKANSSKAMVLMVRLSKITERLKISRMALMVATLSRVNNQTTKTNSNAMALMVATLSRVNIQTTKAMAHLSMTKMEMKYHFKW